MLTLYSGNAGAGKTSSMVDELIDLVKDGRPLYVHAPAVARRGVTPFHEGLELPHVAIDAANWHELVPDGAVLAVDEVQDLWRPRGPGAKVPEAIRELETHRHRNVDVVMSTLKPRLIDQAVRDQVGRHVHIRDTGWLGRYAYEWPECQESPSVSWKTCKLKRRFRVPKRTFEVYKSSNAQGAGQKGLARGKSFMPLITGGLVLAAVLLAFMVVRTIRGHTSGPELAGPSTAASSIPAELPAAGSRRGQLQTVVTAQTLHASFTPRIAERPETAPAYDEIRKVVNMPRIVGGFCVGEICRCYNQQNLSAGISQVACRAWLASPPFDPYYVEHVDRPAPRRDTPAYGAAAAPTDGVTFGAVASAVKQ